MAWEDRPGGRYYYKKRRIGRRVVSEYIGTGWAAELEERTTQEERQRKAEAHRSFMAEIETVKEIEKLVAQAERETMTLVKACILAGGYHKHKGQWRRSHDRR